ncbi:hypothetical protein BGW38_008828, partial [Lunasporangiospora selenospora]
MAVHGCHRGSSAIGVVAAGQDVSDIVVAADLGAIEATVVKAVAPDADVATGAGATGPGHCPEEIAAVVAEVAAGAVAAGQKETCRLR